MKTRLGFRNVSGAGHRKIEQIVAHRRRREKMLRRTKAGRLPR